MRTVWGGGIGTALVLLTAAGGAAQTLESRIAGVGDGDVAFRYEIREDMLVCDGYLSSEEGHRRWGTFRGDQPHRPETCDRGIVEVVLERSGGIVDDIDLRRSAESEPGEHDLGQVASADAARVLLDIARRAPEASGQAIMAATLARGLDVSPTLLDMARDRDLGSRVRKHALFWVGQAAADTIAASLRGIATAEAEDQDVRDAAVFALSQRPAHEAVPLLMELATDAPHVKTRRSALFWLAQSDDERVPDFFAGVILGGRGG